MRRTFLFVGVLLGLTFTLPASGASAFCRMTTSRDAPPRDRCQTEGIPLEWQRRCMSWALEEHGSRDMAREDVLDALNASFEAWEVIECDGGRSIGFQVTALAQASLCDQAEHFTSGPNVNTVAFVDDWAERGYADNAFAITTVWHNPNTGEIYDADMEINELNGPYGDCSASVDGCAVDTMVDLQNVVTHEVGHFFGIAHSNVAMATMVATSRPGEIQKRTLAPDDIEALCTIYPEGSLPDACDPTPRGGLKLTCGPEEDDDCGCRAAGKPNGRASGVLGIGALVGLLAALRMRRRR